jgi:hypothetical protein
VSNEARDCDEWKNEEWKNYETWAVYRWLTRDEGRHQYWRDEARKHWNDALSMERNPVRGGLTIREFARRVLAGYLWAEVDEMSPLKDTSIHSDLLLAALSNVDWRKVAGMLLAEVVEKDPQPSDGNQVSAQVTREKGDHKEASDRSRLELGQVATTPRILQTSWIP